MSQLASAFSLTPIEYAKLPGWNRDCFAEIIPAVLFSAAVILKQDLLSSSLNSWYSFYQEVEREREGLFQGENFRNLICRFLQPYKIESSSLVHFTGYYEPLLYGSLRQEGKYQTPLYSLPTDQGLNGKHPRSAIVGGVLANQALELVWVNDPIAAFFLQIQGSGRVQLESGEVLKIGYAGTNGYPYYPIGKAFIARNLLAKDQVSLQSITNWLTANPDQAEEIMSENQSYVFFKLLAGEGPLGTQGVPLTAQRSLAIDPFYNPLGSLLWVNIDHPLNSSKIQRLMIAQDTGGAIKGPLRADYFWGYGQEAEQAAGQMNRVGEWFPLLPS